MSNIPEKWRISCPLDHSSFEKFVNCDCNYGNARDVWWFKEQQLEKLQDQNKIMREALEFYSVEDDWNFYCGCCANGSTKLEQDHGKLAREALAKAKE